MQYVLSRLTRCLLQGNSAMILLKHCGVWVNIISISLKNNIGQSIIISTGCMERLYTLWVKTVPKRINITLITKIVSFAEINRMLIF